MSESGNEFNRRQFFKTAGAASAALGAAGLGMFGHAAGTDPNTYLGWQTHEGVDQTFDRSSWESDQPTYEKIGPTDRPDARTENIFGRRGRFYRQYKEGVQPEDMDELMQEYYRNNPGDFELDRINMTDIMPNHREDTRKYGDKFLISYAWSNAMGAVQPKPISEPPDESDFPFDRRTGEKIPPRKMKSPELTSKLIKKISHELGSTLVGIAKLNHDWVYKYPNSGRGFDQDQPLEVPEHWQYAIVVGTPMSWDPMYANPVYGTSFDAYSRSRIVAFRVASFIKQLGYAARPHTPGNSYDLMAPPILIDAGIGEQGRHSVVITPELGCNFRPAIITTNLPLVPDKPIDFGVQDFCKTCKICAENCPSGAITLGDKVEVRGYRRYKLNAAKCNNVWNSTLGSMGCRVCISNCPYTRKANWLHKTAFNVSLHDPTGLTDGFLTALQKQFYEAPDPQKYLMPSMGGENTPYRKPPWWMVTEDFIDI